MNRSLFLVLILLIGNTILSKRLCLAEDIAQNSKNNGILVYDCKPLLVVWRNHANVVYVKNGSKSYAVKIAGFLRKNDVNLQFTVDCREVKSRNTFLEIFSKHINLNSIVHEAGNTLKIYELIFNEGGSGVKLKSLSK